MKRAEEPTNERENMNLGDQIKAVVEAQVKAVVEKECDKVVDALLQKIIDLREGGIEDAVVLAMKPKLQPLVKAELLKLADKISADV